MTQFARLNRSLLSPLFAFSAVWLLGALVSQYHLLNSQIDWSEYMVLVVLVVPVAFVAGGLVGEGVAVRISAAREGRRDLDRSSRLLRRILIAFLILGLAELTHQFIKIGGVPLLSPQGNTLRFDQGGPTIILTDLLTVAAIVALVKPRNPFARESRFEMGIALVALGGFALQAGRGSLILPVIVATAARWLYWGRPKATWLGAAGLITFAAVVFGFYIRTKQNPYNPFEAELYGEVLPDTPFYLQALIPLHLAISTNFLALQGLVSFFPTAEPFGAGSYDALGLHHIISGAQNVQDVSAALTPPWVTSTVAGPFWADGGFAALIPGIAMTGFASAGAFAMSMRTRSFRWSLVAGYLLYLALFGVYTNLWTQQIDWILIVPLLLIVGAVGEDPSSPPGVTGWAWARIKRMSGRGGGAPREPAKKRRPLRREKRLALGLVGAGAVVVVLLVVSGLLIQPLIPEPYPLYFTTSLPRSAARSVAVVTDSDRPQDNERLRWVTRSGHGVRVFAYQPTQEEGVAHRSPLIQIPGDVGKASFDVAKWGPWRSMALFSFQQHKKLLSVRVGPTAPDEGAPEEFQAPVSAPPKDAIRDEMVATWSGSEPDLFVLTRGRETSRPVLQILSGESGFSEQVFITRLPFRGLGPAGWSVDVGQIGILPDRDPSRVVKGERVDLLLVQHTAEREHSDVQVLLGESGFQFNAFQRDLDTSGTVPPDTTFALGSDLGATAVYEVQPSHPGAPRLQVFGVASPAGFK